MISRTTRRKEHSYSRTAWVLFLMQSNLFPPLAAVHFILHRRKQVAHGDIEDRSSSISTLLILNPRLLIHFIRGKNLLPNALLHRQSISGIILNRVAAQDENNSSLIGSASMLPIFQGFPFSVACCFEISLIWCSCG